MSKALEEQFAIRRSYNRLTAAVFGRITENDLDISSLLPREREILELRFGLLDGEPASLEEVGKHIGITRERIRQIEDKALVKIRRTIYEKKLHF